MSRCVMSTQKKRASSEAKPKEEDEDEKPPVSHRLHVLRERIWDAMGVVSCVRYASDSMLTPQKGEPDVEGAMALLGRELNEISGAMEGVIEELGGPPQWDDE